MIRRGFDPNLERIRAERAFTPIGKRENPRNHKESA
jgi:hypothetical protein